MQLWPASSLGLQGVLGVLNQAESHITIPACLRILVLYPAPLVVRDSRSALTRNCNSPHYSIPHHHFLEQLMIGFQRKDWGHPEAPVARITKMKDGQTHLAHKCEHAVDMDTGAMAGVTVQTMDGRDTDSLEVILDALTEQLEALDLMSQEVVADKGYHSNMVMVSIEACVARSYISEAKRGRRNCGNRGKSLLRQRGEKVERAFTHLLETSGLRRVHVRDNLEILKRMILQGAAFNPGLLMRACCCVVKLGVLQGKGPSNWHWQGPSSPLIRIQPSMN